jgi:WD40-like Beta Propeller Repeat
MNVTSVVLQLSKNWYWGVLVCLPFALVAVPDSPAPAKQGVRLTPTNLRSVNTSKDEDDPYLHVAAGGRRRTLYYCSNASGRPSLYMSVLDRRGEWTSGKMIDGPDQETANCSPCLSLDGHDLYFASIIPIKAPDKKDDPEANLDIVHAIKLIKDSQFTAPTPLQSVCTRQNESHPWITADRHEFYFSRKTSSGWRVWHTSRDEANGAFGAPQQVDEFAPGFHHATVSTDGKTMFLQGPLDNNRWGLFRSRRARVGSAWSTWSEPEPLSGLNSPATDAPLGDMSPSLSRDGLKLYFCSDRRGGQGGRDLWVINAPSLISGVLTKKK